MFKFVIKSSVYTYFTMKMFTIEKICQSDMQTDGTDTLINGDGSSHFRSDN